MPKPRKEKNVAKLRNQLSVLVAMKEAKDRRTYTRNEIAEAAGISLDSVQKMMNNQTDRYDGKIVMNLCKWLGVSPSVFFSADYEDFHQPLSVNASYVYAAGAGD